MHATTPPPATTFLKDYQPPAYLVDRVFLDVTLDPATTQVKSRLLCRRHPDGAGGPLFLHGENLALLYIALDGLPLAETAYHLSNEGLTIPHVPDVFVLELIVTNQPEKNTALSGLYVSSGMLCTQCEAEGFRHITYYPDRPDVLAIFDVRIEADQSAYPVLLSNGNKTKSGNLDNGRHFVTWADPHPKPAYLFALVGGDLTCHADRFTTRSGRDVTLQLFVDVHNVNKCAYTLDVLKRAMAWDEEAFGREYDLDIFMIVAVDHFNFGAMENKGLNIFNSACVLASPETATDADYALIETIVAHEYFHNWSGNRVTCRDWFQLCLKEGFTVYRDQEFSAAQRGQAVQRIKNVRTLRATQFPEDAGPLAHPPRPEHYITIDNFYTNTVYDKGAELVRMMRVLIGAENFRKASDLYFARHDGTAATVEDFVLAMEECSGLDLTQFRRWYCDAGTPIITIRESWDGEVYDLSLTQETKPTPGQAEKPPRHMPLDMALILPDGTECAHQLVELKHDCINFTFPNLPAKPVASIPRQFSAPVKIDYPLTVDERLTLIRHDTDTFNRWQTTYEFALDLVKSFAGVAPMANAQSALDAFGAALTSILNDESLSTAYRAEILTFPAIATIAQAIEEVDPTAITQAHKRFHTALRARLETTLMTLYNTLTMTTPYAPDATQAGQRSLRNAVLTLLMAEPNEEVAALCLEQATTATNMTDEGAAVALLIASDLPARTQVLDRFYQKWCHDSLVINKWLSWQSRPGAATDIAHLQNLLNHDAFDITNPNKVRAVLGVFVTQNLDLFHAADGSGYNFFFDQLCVLDKINPQTAARLAVATEIWPKLEPGRKEKLRAQLHALSSKKGLSRNLFEVIQRLSNNDHQTTP